MAPEGGNQLLPVVRRKGIGRWWNEKKDERKMQNAQGVGKRRRRRIISCSNVGILEG